MSSIAARNPKLHDKFEHADTVRQQASDLSREARCHFDNATSAAKEARLWEAIDEAGKAFDKGSQSNSKISESNHIRWEAAKDAAREGWESRGGEPSGGCVIS